MRLSDNATRLGDGPRIAPLEMREMTPELLTILECMNQVNVTMKSRQAELISVMLDVAAGRLSPEETVAALARVPEIVRTLVRHPDLFNANTGIGLALLTEGVISFRERELAVLRIGWLCQAPYEWGEHVIVAKRAGITTAEIERVTVGSTAPEWSRHERAILTAVEELHGDAMISDATWATLTETYDEKQMIELPMIVGQYQSVAYYQNSLRLRLHEGNLGLEAR